MNKDLFNIKDKYGEKMMHLCRKNFSTILENEGQLFYLLSSNFAYSKCLYEDIVNNSLEGQFKNYIYSLLEPIKELPVVDDSSCELLEKAGYTLYECKTEEDINSFRKYYSVDEALCTFRGDRLNECYVFFAVKHDVLEINRKDYIYPQRQDKYGTSVIGIQFTRGNVNTLSIKNRYNHSVVNPDATFSNNLENIIPGLTRSFERDYNLNICQNNFGDFEIPGYVKANDGRYYKYNYEINNIYYCNDNVIIKNLEVVRDYQEKEKYIIIDYFIIDLVNKKISLYDKSINDSFISGLENIMKIEINKDKTTNNKVIDIILENGNYVCIEIDKYNRIISYNNKNLSDVGDNFLYYNKSLNNIDISNVIRIGSGFLYSNNSIISLDFAKLIEIKDDFLYKNKIVNYVYMPMVKEVGNNFLKNNECLGSLHMSNLEKTGNNFIAKNNMLSDLDLHSLIYVGDYFLWNNKKLLKLDFPYLIYAGKWFISGNKIVKEVNCLSLREVGDNFLCLNNSLVVLYLPSLEKVGNRFLLTNKSLISLYLPNLKIVENEFLSLNNSLKRLYAPKLIKVGNKFLLFNKTLINYNLSSLEQSEKVTTDVKKRILRIS